MATALNSDLGGIPQFDCEGDNASIASRWKRWKRAFQLFAEGKGVKDAKQKKSLMLHCAGMNVQDIFFTLEEGQGDNDFEKAVNALDKYFEPQVSSAYERYVFRKMEQSENETIEQYVTRLKQKAVNCEFENVNNSIRDQVIEKCKSNKLRRKLLEKGQTLTLQNVLEVGRAHETADAQARSIEGSQREINRVTEPKAVSRHAKTPNSHNRNACFRCGREGHYGRDPQCPAKTKRCNKCQNIGHFEKCCKTKQKYSSTPSHRRQKQHKSRVNQVKESADTDSDDEYSFTIQNYLEGEKVNVNVGGIDIKMLIDSGSSANLIDKDMWVKLKEKHIKCESYKTDRKLYVYGSQTPLQLIGCFKADVVIGDACVAQEEFCVFDGKGEALLSKRTAIKLRVLKVGPNVNTVSGSRVPDKFPSLFEGFGKLKNFQLELPIDKSVKPIAQQPRRVPFSLREKLDKKLDELENFDIIERVEGPTPWISPVVVVPKGDKDIRLCIDMRCANACIVRERHPIPTIEEVLQDLNQSTVFSKLDIKWAYHQIELSENTRYVTTFVTHRGLYRYKRLLFGVSCATEMYQRVMQQALRGCDGVHNIHDDIIVYGATEAEHDARLENVLKTLQEKGLTLNRDKCQFNMSQLTFMGHVLSAKGIGAAETKVKAVVEARQPETATEVRSFLGLVNFSGRYIEDLATVSEPLRRLTKKSVPFEWGPEQEKSFNALKQRLSKAETLGYFDKNAKTILITDASPVGLGAVLVQETKSGTRKVISYASRSLTDVERRYSTTEKEALGIVWACERFHMYIYGVNFELVTDHKPLEFIYSKRSKPSARIERWVLRLQPYTFTVRYSPGSSNIADSLSRLTITEPKTSKSDDTENYVKFVAKEATPNAITTRELERASEADDELSHVRHCLKTGQWYKLEKKTYLPVKHELSIVGKLLLRGTRIVVPREYRDRILSIAHEGHPGIVSMKSRVRCSVWWPGIDRDVEQFCKTCHGCQIVSQGSPPEPMERTPLPSGPWQDVAADLLGPLPDGNYILVVVDYFSRYYEVRTMKTITSDKVIEKCRQIFSIHGLPLSMRTDNGRQFVSDNFENFLTENGIEHRRNTPLWPQANGEVERQNRSLMKRIRIAHAEGKNWKQEVETYLVTYRNTPHSTTGIAPSELLFRRKLRTKMPDLQHLNVEDGHYRDVDSERKEKGKQYGDNIRHAKPSDLKPGDRVLLKQKKENKFSTTFEKTPYDLVEKNGNSVVIQSNDGLVMKRNSSHVKKFNEKSVDESYNTDDTDVKHSDNLDNDTAVQIQDRPKRSIKLPAKYDDFVMK